jgi:uracil-DNA glycosylase family 4
MTPEPAPTVQQLLAFYLEAGVDCALTEEPVNRLSEHCAPPPAKPRPSPSGNFPPRSRPARSEIAPAPEAAIVGAGSGADRADAGGAARAVGKFRRLRAEITATRLVFADGNPQARIMFVGEAPGREEDIEGLPFVGRSGKLLDRMIAAIGLDRSKAYIANVIPWRPPGNRTPTPQETQICLPFIQRQIELVNPDVLVTLGNPSTQTLLSTREGIMKPAANGSTTTPARAPSARWPRSIRPICLRSPSYKRMAWQDLRAIAKALEQEILPHPEERRLRRVSKDGHPSGSWFETAQERLLTMRERLPKAPSAARWPSRSATAAAGRSPAIRTRAALPAPGRETAARCRPAACRWCRRRARPRRRRFR